ncbi:response regulator transcription factor [Nitrosococcus wardiae]|uniref:Response regulator transcription factor n=1 Tax=Nitrosococcus wardiae TaxID=1814290 RepID=A0A4P7C0P8_9GAMM|nr:response regulator [Nitrosococcus wardiae]QBQ55110.1 response regulator transcription factor [Nitrosococcus wardiae]
MGSQYLQKIINPAKYLRDKIYPRKQTVPKPTVFIVDSNHSRDPTLSRLNNAQNWEVKIYSSAEAFLEAFDPSHPGCLLLDVHVPKMGGLALQKQLEDQNSELPLLFVSTQGTVSEAVQAIHAGAVDFLIKPVKQSLLLERLQEGLAQSLRIREAQRKQEEMAARISQLTPREQQVMERLIEGKLSKVIASELGISTKIVDHHRAQVMAKLQTRNRAELLQLTLSGPQGAREKTPRRVSL